MSHLLLFDPYTAGHHAEHIRHVLRGWHERYGDADEHRVTVAVAPKLLADHPDLRALADELGPRVEFVEAPETEALGGSLPATGWWHRRVLARLVEDLRPSHVFLLYLDHAQLALALGLRFPFPVVLSGILFRPSFHYGQLETTTPSLKERVKRLRKRLVLRAALRNPHLTTLFTLDPSAVPVIAEFAGETEVVGLPDPIDPGERESEAALAAVRSAYGVEDGRVLALLFGLLAERKGVFVVLDALRRLPAAAQKRLAVLFAGAVRSETRKRLDAAVAAVGPPAQVLLHDTFVPDDEVQALVQASDLVLVPYQQHVGSSGVLIRAAAAGTPVIGQEYGAVGYQIRTHRLGRDVDSTRADTLAAALKEFLEDPEAGFDAEAARAFAERNTVAAYQRVLFDHLTLEPSALPTT